MPRGLASPALAPSAKRHQNVPRYAVKLYTSVWNKKQKDPSS